jgi:hypothetical protein
MQIINAISACDHQHGEQLLVLSRVAEQPNLWLRLISLQNRE